MVGSGETALTKSYIIYYCYYVCMQIGVGGTIMRRLFKFIALHKFSVLLVRSSRIGIKEVSILISSQRGQMVDRFK